MSRSKTRSAALALVGGLIVMVVSQGRLAQAQEVFVLDDAVKMSPDGKIFSHVPLEGYASQNPAWDGKTISLAGAKGETLAFQVMVRPQGARRAVDVKVSALKSEAGTTIAGKNVALFREWYVKVTRPSTSPAGSTGVGEYPDALIPADVADWGLPVTVDAGKVQGIWVDVKIPRDAKTGIHRGTVAVTADGKPLATLPLTLEVLDFTIPTKRHLRWRIGYGLDWITDHYKIRSSDVLGEESEELRGLEEDLYRLCWEEHRFVPTTHYISLRCRTTGRGKDLKIDWTGFDRRFGKYLDGSAFEDREPVNIFSLPINVMRGWPTGGNRVTPDRVDADALAAAIRQTARHWDEKKWRLEDTFVYVADEPGPEGYAAIRKACEAIRKADRRVATSVAFYTQFGPHGREIVKEFSGYVTMWDIAGDYMYLPHLDGRQAAGDTVGFYQGSEPFQGSEALDADGLALTTWPWIAWRYKLDTLFLYCMTEWSYFRLDRKKTAWSDLPRNVWVNPLNQSWQTNSQGVLLYPGQHIGVKGVIPTIRLKQVRRGMLDYAYFKLLEEKGKKSLADAVVRRVIPRALHEAVEGNKVGDAHYGLAKWERDPRKWAAARREMAQAIVE